PAAPLRGLGLAGLRGQGLGPAQRRHASPAARRHRRRPVLDRVLPHRRNPPRPVHLLRHPRLRKAEPAAYRGQLTILIALDQPVPNVCCKVMCRNWKPSSSRARLSGPASIGRRPPEAAMRDTACLASASSPAMNTSSGAPPAWPATSVPANVVLKALTTRAPGAAAAICSAADVPAGTTSESNVAKSTGLEMSTTIWPASSSR